MALRGTPGKKRLTVTHVGMKDGLGVSDFKTLAENESALATIFTKFADKGVKIAHVSSRTDSDRNRRRSFADKEQNAASNCDASSADILGQLRINGRIAWKCHKGMKPDSPNQDSFAIVHGDQEFGMYCVFDGHGPNGHDASEIARSFLVADFLRRNSAGGGDVRRNLEEAFSATHKLLADTSALFEESNHKEGCNFEFSGTTGTVAYHDMLQKKLWVAHVGDSRAVLGLRSKRNEVTSKELTKDHKPDTPAERARIQSAGGRVVFDGFYNHRVFSAQGMYPGLNMSRALGDCIGHTQAGIIAIPEVLEFNLDGLEGEVVLLVCTDGVWEFIPNDEAVKMVMGTESNSKDLSTKLGVLSQTSWDRWMADSDNELSDDITGIAVRLQ